MFLQEVHHVVKNAFSLYECNHIIGIGENQQLKESEVQDGDSTHRSSNVSWVNDRIVIENWHIDSHFEPYDNGMIRKLSFTVILNTDYEGGEFDITVPNPKNIDTQITYEKPNIGDLILFPSHIWHKVRPVKSGVRKSLVGWVLGNPFI